MMHSAKHSGVLLLFVLLTNLAIAQAQRQDIKGTAYSLIPPAGFTASNMFQGFMNEELGASIMISEIPGPFHAVSAGLTAEGFKTQGMTLTDKQTIDFNGGKALYIRLSQQAYGTTYQKQMLAFGDSNHSVLVNGIYPIAAKHLEPAIKEAILSIQYNASKKPDPVAAASFSISIDGTPYKYASAIGGALMYNVEGKIPSERPSMVLSRSISTVQIPDKEQFAKDRLKRLPGMAAYTIQSGSPVNIDQMQGYEIVAKGQNKKAKEELVYELALFNQDGSYYLLIGMSTEDHDVHLAHFKKIARTFKRKP